MDDPIYYEVPNHKVVFVTKNLEKDCSIEWTENLPDVGEFVYVDELGDKTWKVNMIIKKYIKMKYASNKNQKECIRFIYLDEVIF